MSSVYLVCGGRFYAEECTLNRVLDFLSRPSLLVTGGAPGADTLADSWARSRGIARVTFWANWEGEGRKAAGPLRNARMLDLMPVDLVVAFPGGKGTADMVGRARARGIEVLLSQTLEFLIDG